MYKKSNFSYNFSLPNVTFTEYKDIILYTYINKKIIQKFNSFIKFAILKGPKISVAIPIYNGVKYLYYYLRSIQNQKKKEIPIILVDDCSTDKSYDIIENYMKYDKRIRF